MKLYVADDLALPADAVTMTFGVLAVRGAGKSNLAAVMAEEMFAAHLPFVVVDPVGSWWGLRSSGDGRSSGLPVTIFGGRHGDVPLERSAGNLIADLVAERRLTCVLDLSEFASEGDKKAFLLDFARRLYRKNQEPLHLFLEEADDYIPQRPMRDEAQLLRAWENIVRRGRARGLGITLITQRSAVLNKNVLTQVENLFVLRTTGPQDRAAIETWIKYHAQATEVLESLPSLETGEAWFWSPYWMKVMQRTQTRRRHTFDSAATPKGAKTTKPATLADVDLSAIQREMAATIEKAKEEDPRELRKRIIEANRRIAQLERQLQERPSAETVRVEVPVFRDHELDRLAAAADTAQGAARELANASEVIRDAAAQAKRKDSTHKRAQATHALDRVFAKPLSKYAPPNSEPTANGSLTGPEQRILDALAWLESIGVMEAEQSAVAFLAGYTVGGGAFNNPRGALRTKGLIEYRSGGQLAMTDAGRAYAQVPDEPLTTEELQRKVLERLPGPERKILAVLLEAYPADMAYDELAQRAGYAEGGGAFNNPRGRLRSLGLIMYTHGRRARAADLLFLEPQEASAR